MAQEAPKAEEKKNEDEPKYEATLESTQELNESDKALLEKVNKKYGDRLEPLYPNVIRNFITGYAHFAADKREQETYDRIDHYFDRHDTYKFGSILDQKLENEDKMLAAWKLFIYGTHVLPVKLCGLVQIRM